MIEEIRLHLKDGVLEIELVGQIAGILALTNDKGPGVSTGASDC